MQKPFLIKGLGWPAKWGKGLTTKQAIAAAGLPAGDPVSVWLVNPEATIDNQGDIVGTYVELIGTGEITANLVDVKIMRKPSTNVTEPSEKSLPTVEDPSKIRSGKTPTQPPQGNDDMTDKQATARAPKAFNLPAGESPKAPNEASKRGKAYQLIARPEGATIEQIMEATGWNKRNATEGVRLLNKANGLGLVGDEDGVIKLA